MLSNKTVTLAGAIQSGCSLTKKRSILGDRDIAIFKVSAWGQLTDVFKAKSPWKIRLSSSTVDKNSATFFSVAINSRSFLACSQRV